VLMTGPATLQRARHEGWALGAFSAYNAELAAAIVTAAERTRMPVILQAGSSAFGYAGEQLLADIALSAARHSTAPVGVHLDHCRDLDELKRCVDRGYTSVMIDGSHLPYEDNLTLTKAAAAYAHAADVWIEAELGHVPGDEDQSTGAQPAAMTDPQLARQFVNETRVDALAVAVGNVHGYTAFVQTIDLDRLADIAANVAVPLVLHGASGLPAEQLQAAIGLGVAKININTEVRTAFLDGLRDSLATAASDNLSGPFTAARSNATATITEKIQTLGHPAVERRTIGAP